MKSPPAAITPVFFAPCAVADSEPRPSTANDAVSAASMADAPSDAIAFSPVSRRTADCPPPRARVPDTIAFSSVTRNADCAETDTSPPIEPETTKSVPSSADS